MRTAEMPVRIPPVFALVYAVVAGILYPCFLWAVLSAISPRSSTIVMALFLGPFALAPAIVLFPIGLFVRRHQLSKRASIAYVLGSIVIFTSPASLLFCFIGGALLQDDMRNALFCVPIVIIPYPSVAILIGFDLFRACLKSRNRVNSIVARKHQKAVLKGNSFVRESKALQTLQENRGRSHEERSRAMTWPTAMRW